MYEAYDLNNTLAFKQRKDDQAVQELEVTDIENRPDQRLIGDLPRIQAFYMYVNWMLFHGRTCAKACDAMDAFAVAICSFV